MAMMAITTRSSMRVKPVTKRPLGKRLSWAERHFGEIRFTKNFKMKESTEVLYSTEASSAQFKGGASNKLTTKSGRLSASKGERAAQDWTRIKLDACQTRLPS